MNEIAKTSNGHGNSQLPAEPVAQPANIPSAVASVMDGLKQAITTMDADDLSVELSAYQEGGQRSGARFSIRAYRRGRKVVDESGESGE